MLCTMCVVWFLVITTRVKIGCSLAAEVPACVLYPAMNVQAMGLLTFHCVLGVFLVI